MVREDLVPESVLFALFPDPYRVVTESINFIEETDDQPFLLQASIPGPHDLEQVPGPVPEHVSAGVSPCKVRRG